MANGIAELIERDATSHALRHCTTRLTALLQRVTDTKATAIGVWTIGDVGNHVTRGIENYTLWMEDKEAPDLDAIENMSEWNVETVRGLPPADLPQLAGRIETATDRFIEAANAKPPSSEVRWYAGNRIPVRVAVCMRLVEAVIHGRDIATAANEEWPIDPDHARTMAYGLGYIGPYFVDDSKLDFAGTIEMRVRGGARLYYVVENRSLKVQTSAPTADWHLSVDPVAWVLVATQRLNQWRAALGGKIIGWGRRPSLPFRLRAATFKG
jgi:uncharacterized protein (TIGR03083 family)